MSAAVVVATDNLRHWPMYPGSAVVQALVANGHREWWLIRCCYSAEFLYATPAGSCVTCLWCARRGP